LKARRLSSPSEIDAVLVEAAAHAESCAGKPPRAVTATLGRTIRALNTLSLPDGDEGEALLKTSRHYARLRSSLAAVADSLRSELPRSISTDEEP